MTQLPQLDADLVVRVPLPHADISEADLNRTRSDFQADGLTVSFRAEEIYPVSHSWAEIALIGGSFLAGASANHYAEKFFDALDRFLKRKFDQVTLGVSKGDKSVYCNLSRDNRDEAIAHIRKALAELEAGDPKPPTA